MNIDIPAFWRTIGRMTLPVLPLFVISGFVIRIVGLESRLALLAITILAPLQPEKSVCKEALT